MTTFRGTSGRGGRAGWGGGCGPGTRSRIFDQADRCSRTNARTVGRSTGQPQGCWHHRPAEKGVRAGADRRTLPPMTTLETDYLVVGAGAAGMAFVDEILTHTEADVVLVERRDQPGGHWNDAYPFVTLHLPSAYYGVNSRPLGTDRVDEHGPNAGLYERASGVEIRNYYLRLLQERFLTSGRVRFLGLHEFEAAPDGGGRVTSHLTGASSDVAVCRATVDATYLETSVPATHA